MSEADRKALETAILGMRATLMAKRTSLAFAAPEVANIHWADLDARLQELMTDLYERARDERAD